MNRIQRSGIILTVAIGVALVPVVNAAAATKPSNTAAPTISGTAAQGATLTATTGTWSGTQPISYSLQWNHCNTSTGSCNPVSGATASTYLLGAGDVGWKMQVTVKATNSAGYRSTHSTQTAKVVATPTNYAAPSTSGTPAQGSTLTASPGSWYGATPITFTYQWQRCVVGGSCSNISGATSSTYLAGTADVGRQIVVVVKGTNSAGSSTASSVRTSTVVGTPPSNTAAPTVSGTAQDTATLTAAPGTWGGSAPITFTYQWQNCAPGASCTNISGATSSTYVAASSDVGQTLRVQVTGANSGGSSSALSVQTAPVVAAAPVNTAAPTVSGNTQDGETLTASNGTWTGTPTITYSYQWRNCGEDDTCVDIAGANSSSYQLTASDVGDTIVVQVTGSNDGGSSNASSLPTNVVAAAPPTNLTVPEIDGTAQAGSGLSASPGAWSGTTPSYDYQWQHCDDSGGACTDISTATGGNFTPRPVDIGGTIRVGVTASNAAGHAKAFSAVTAQVAASGNPPSADIAPSVSGTPQDGSTLTADPGSWTGDSPIGYDFQWQQCDSTGQICNNITNADGSTYQLTGSDVGAYLVVQVTASNNGGSSYALSAPVGPIAASPPQNGALDPPSISGTPRDGSAMSVSAGTWTGTPEITFGYQWQDCDSAGLNCIDINGATIATYTVTGSDIGATLVAKVTGTNMAGSATVASAPTDVVVAAPPLNQTAPSISGSAQDGSTLTALAGTWSGTLPITFTYQWQRCAATCDDISGATATTYDVTSADVRRTLDVRVTAHNQVGDSTLTSPQTQTVDGTGPVNQTAPSITGTAQVGRTLTAGNGSWKGSTPMSFAYQWLQCDSTGTACVAETQTATSSTYLVKTYDKGTKLAVQVTATNVAGNGSATSSATAAVTASSSAVTTALWHMEDSATAMLDSSGYANDGTLTAVTTGQSGFSGNGFGFFGSPSRAAVGSSASLDPGTTKMTVTVHVKFATAPSAAVGDYDLIRKGLSTTSGGDWKVEIQQTGQASCTGVGGSGSRTLTAGPNLADNVWHTIVCVETSSSLKITVDGAVVGTLSASIGKIANTDPLTVAAKIIDGDQYTGVMDEVSIAMG